MSTRVDVSVAKTLALGYNQIMNWDMLGHEWAVQLLKEQAIRGVTRHAYLITGPQGVGRRTMAIRLAQTLNCLHSLSPGEACFKCHTCVRIERMQHPDLAVVRSDQEGGTIKVAQIRELQHILSLSPYEAPYRVALLLSFENASHSAANALLKTLEEPPPKVVLIISAESGERLLPTIVSRCEVLRLRPLAFDVVSRGLQAQWNLPREQAILLAHISGGRPGYALRLHRDPNRMELRNKWLDEHSYMLSASRLERFTYAESIAKDKETLRNIFNVWLSLWRDILILISGSSPPIINLDRKEEIEKLASNLDLETSSHKVSTLERTLELLDRNVNARLATEALLLDLPKR